MTPRQERQQERPQVAHSWRMLLMPPLFHVSLSVWVGTQSKVALVGRYPPQESHKRDTTSETTEFAPAVSCGRVSRLVGDGSRRPGSHPEERTEWSTGFPGEDLGLQNAAQEGPTSYLVPLVNQPCKKLNPTWMSQFGSNVKQRNISSLTFHCFAVGSASLMKSM